MSADACGWVYRHSPYRGSTFSVHHAIADSVNDQNHNELWLTTPKLATKARVDERTARTALRTLEDDGFIAMVKVSSRRPGDPNHWRFLFPDVPVVYESRWTPPGSTPGVRPGVPKTPGPTPPPTPGDTPGEQGVSDPETPGPTPPKPKEATQDATQTDQPLSPDGDEAGVSFDDFWEAAPSRNGLKLGKKAAMDRWGDLNPADQVAAVAAAKNYAGAVAQGIQKARDPEGFLRNRWWEDWVPESPDSSAPPKPPCALCDGRGYTEPTDGSNVVVPCECQSGMA